jgi:phenylacetate-CoA ligase
MDRPFQDGVWSREELLQPEQIRELQAERLRATARRCYEHVPFYKRTFDQLGISPDDLHSVADVAKLPFTTKADLRDGYPTEFWTIGREELVRVHGSSGTTGKSTLVAYTQADMDLWAECVARFLTAGGATSKHLAQVAFGYGLFTGGFGLHYGLERIGVAVVPASAGNTRRQITLLQDLGADLLICTPSYALTLAEAMRDAGVDPNDILLSMGHFGGEPWTDAMRLQIEAGLGIHAYNNYGLSEIIGPGVSGECREHAGMHIAEDHFLAEIIDPDTGQALPDGETGELVLTTLTREGMPMIRYRTRDITSLDRTQCACGRWMARMARVMGRTDDMLIIRGVNVYPSQVEQALMTVEGTLPFYRIVVERNGTLDEMTVQVEVQPELFSDEMKQMTILRDRIEREVHSITGVRSHIQLMEPNSLERSIGKAVRVQDNREL